MGPAQPLLLAALRRSRAHGSTRRQDSGRKGSTLCHRGPGAPGKTAPDRSHRIRRRRQGHQPLDRAKRVPGHCPVRPHPGIVGTAPGLPPKSGCGSATALPAQPCSEGLGTLPGHRTFTSPHPHVLGTRSIDIPTGALGFLRKPGLSPPRCSRATDGEKRVLLMRKEGR